MFNSKLKKEILQLREDLLSMEQVKSSLDSEMLVLHLDPQGRIESVLRIPARVAAGQDVENEARLDQHHHGRQKHRKHGFGCKALQ